MHSKFYALIAAMGIVMCSSPAAAQTKDEVKEAQAHFQKGAEWFAEGEYAKAVVEFMSGHAIAPNAMFLYNVSLAYERLGNIPDALSAAERSRQFEGMPDDVTPRNEARIVAFEILLESEDVAAEVESAVARADDDTTEEPDDKGGEPPEMITRPDGIKVLGWTGVALAVAGGGFAFGGFATNSAIRQDIEAYEEAARTGDGQTYDELRDQIASRQRNGKIFYGIGAAAAGVGLTLFVVDLLAGTETVPAAAFVSPTTDGASVGVVVKLD
jgi:hypothetical protein